MTSATHTPMTTRRLLSPDLARGMMLLFIAMAYAGVYAGAGFGVDVSDEPMLDRAAAFASTLFLDNRAFPMFAILFGYGLAWSVGRQSARGVEPHRIRRTLQRRAGLLLLLGAFHLVLVFPGEILTSYGLALLITGWLLFRSNRALHLVLLTTGLFYLLMVPLIMVSTALAPGEGFAQAVPGYSTAGDWIERLVSVPFIPIYTAIAYPLLFTVVLGYRAGRARLFEQTTSRHSLLRGVAVGGVGTSVIGALPASLVAVGAVDPGPAATGLLLGLQVLTGVAGGAGYAACFALGAELLQRLVPQLTRAVAAVGKRSLTFYILNSTVVALILHPELVGVGPRVGASGAIGVAALTWSAGVVLASWLERTGQPGPLEQLMRRGITVPEATTPKSEPSEVRIRLPRLRIERRAVVWWMLRALVLWGWLVVALVAAYVIWEPARVWLIVPIVVVSASFLVKLAVEPWWRYRVHRWEVTDHAAYASNGWLVREWRVAPMTRIQTVDAVRGPLEQFLGLSTLRVTTASSYGSIDVNGLDRRTAEDAATRLAMAAELTEGDAT